LEKSCLIGKLDSCLEAYCLIERMVKIYGLGKNEITGEYHLDKGKQLRGKRISGESLDEFIEGVKEAVDLRKKYVFHVYGSFPDEDLGKMKGALQSYRITFKRL
jgi:hypothetical protein